MFRIVEVEFCDRLHKKTQTNGTRLRKFSQLTFFMAMMSFIHGRIYDAKDDIQEILMSRKAMDGWSDRTREAHVAYLIL